MKRSLTHIRRWLGLGTLLALGAGTWLVRQYDWEHIERALASGPGCPLRAWTGLLCAFCGMTHSWIAMGKGEWARAFAENTLGPPALAATIAIASSMVIRREALPWPRQTLGIALVVLGTFALARNF